MKSFSFIRSNYFFYGLILSLYFIYISTFVKPWDFKYFSFVDDGQVVVQSSVFFKKCLFRGDCTMFIDQTFEFGTYRFRPAYWLINNINYLMFGNNASYHHIYRAYFIGGMIVFLMSYILRQSNISKIITFFSTILFYTTFSFTENIVRLGTNEPYQVLFLAIFTVLYFVDKNSRTAKKVYLHILMLITLFWSLLIKENNIAVLFTLILYEYIRNKNIKKVIKDRNIIYFLMLGVLVLLGMIITKNISSDISLNIPVYASNYTSNLLLIMKNTQSNTLLLINTLSPFLKISAIIALCFIVFGKFKESFFQEKILYWLILSLFSIIILSPWKFVLERYLLVGIFSIVISISFILDRVLNIVIQYITRTNEFINSKLIVFDLLTIIILSNLFSRGFSVNLAKTINYRNWFETFTRFEHDQISDILRFDPEKVYINAIYNIDNWEYLYEIPIHLKYIYNQTNSDIKLTENLNTDRYIFYRSSLTPKFSLEEIKSIKSNIVTENSYEVKQIDPLAFRSKFIMKPIHSLIDPPYQDKAISYYYEIIEPKHE